MSLCVSVRVCTQVVAVKAPGFGERKTSYLEDIAILTGGQMVKDELGIALDKAGEEVLGVAAKVRHTQVYTYSMHGACVQGRGVSAGLCCQSARSPHVTRACIAQTCSSMRKPGLTKRVWNVAA